LATHITSPAYYHLQAANLLPKNVHKVLYLDGDMLVNGDLSELWNIDLSGKSYAGVEDCCYYDSNLYQHLCYDATKGYVNNGMMLYNFDYLREIDYPKKSIEYVNQYPERIKWMDQDLDNILLLDGKVAMPLQYNFQTLFLLDYHWKNYSQEFKNQVLAASKNPVVIHYCGRIKPWHFKYWLHPYAQLWHKYRKMSPWKGAIVRKPIGKYVKFEAQKIMKRKQLLNKVHQEYISQAWNLYAY